MESGAQDVYTDPLFVGLTRPATMWGVPYMAFVIEFMATTLIFLAAGNPLYLLLVVPIHAIFMWIKTLGRCRNTRFWGAASFSPLATTKWTK